MVFPFITRLCFTCFRNPKHCMAEVVLSPGNSLSLLQRYVCTYVLALGTYAARDEGSSWRWGRLIVCGTREERVAREKQASPAEIYKSKKLHPDRPFAPKELTCSKYWQAEELASQAGGVRLQFVVSSPGPWVRMDDSQKPTAERIFVCFFWTKEKTDKSILLHFCYEKEERPFDWKVSRLKNWTLNTSSNTVMWTKMQLRS